MKYLKFLAIGTLFGIVMAKSGAISWYRIQEMFHFQSFHMYGIIGSAVLLGIVLIQLIKRRKLRDLQGIPIQIPDKKVSLWRYILGGTIFGFGWALTGACPGPMFVLLGQGYLPLLVVIGSAALGTLAYGLVRDKLPH